LLWAVANCSEQTVNLNTNVAADVCKVALKETSGLAIGSEKSCGTALF